MPTLSDCLPGSPHLRVMEAGAYVVGWVLTSEVRQSQHQDGHQVSEYRGEKCLCTPGTPTNTLCNQTMLLVTGNGSGELQALADTSKKERSSIHEVLLPMVLIPQPLQACAHCFQTSDIITNKASCWCFSSMCRHIGLLWFTTSKKFLMREASRTKQAHTGANLARNSTPQRRLLSGLDRSLHCTSFVLQYKDWEGSKFCLKSSKYLWWAPVTFTSPSS